MIRVSNRINRPTTLGDDRGRRNLSSIVNFRPSFFNMQDSSNAQLSSNSLLRDVGNDGSLDDIMYSLSTSNQFDSPSAVLDVPDCSIQDSDLPETLMLPNFSNIQASRRVTLAPRPLRPRFTPILTSNPACEAVVDSNLLLVTLSTEEKITIIETKPEDKEQDKSCSHAELERSVSCFSGKEQNAIPPTKIRKGTSADDTTAARKSKEDKNDSLVAITRVHSSDILYLENTVSSNPYIADSSVSNEPSQLLLSTNFKTKKHDFLHNIFTFDDSN